MSFSDLFENTYLNGNFSGIRWLTHEISLGLAYNITDAGTGGNCGEVTGEGYLRIPVPPIVWRRSTVGMVSNQHAATFQPVLEPWGMITHFVLFTSTPVGTGGVILYGLLATPRDLTTPEKVALAEGRVVLAVDEMEIFLE